MSGIEILRDLSYNDDGNMAGGVSMIKVKIVEDDPKYVAEIRECLERYGKEHRLVFDATSYESGLEFLNTYDGGCDLVFMDIRLKDIDGIETSKRLRKIDQRAALVFVTDYSQFAVNGYEVDALGYIVKPLTYSSFEMVLKKAVERILALSDDRFVLIYTDGSTVRVNIRNIVYVEVMSHDITYHTVGGEFLTRGALKAVEEKFKENGFHFARCGNSYLVNLDYVQKIKGNTVIVGPQDKSEELPISQPKRKKFMNELMEYYGGRF